MVNTPEPLKSVTATPAKPNATPTAKPIEPSKKADSDNGRMAYSLKIRIGDLEFSNLKGDFLGTPVLVLSTRQVGQIDFVLNELSSEQNQSPQSPAPIADPTKPDPKTPPATATKPATISPATIPPVAKPDANKLSPIAPADLKKAIDTTPESTTSLWSRIKAQEGAEVQIESGFPPLLYNKLVGKAYRIGRRMPDGIVLEIVDLSTMAQSTAPTITNSTDPNTAAANSKIPDGPVLDSAGKPILKPDGKPYLISEGKPLLDAAKKPVMGTDGKPVLTILDAKGEPIVGADNRPIVVKPVSIPFPASSPASVPLATSPATTATIAAATISAKSPQKTIAAAATNNSKIAPTTSAQSVAKVSGLKFEKKTDSATGAKGSIGLNTSALSTAVKDAAKQGDVVVVDGNTIKQVAPGAGTSTGLIIDWNQHKSIFVRKPVVMKKTPNHLASAAGIMAVQGWDVNGKQSVGGFAVVPGAFTPVPGGQIVVPEWGALKMSDPIVPGCLYTWGDATKEGNRVPQSKAIVKGIIEIAQQLMVFHGQGMNGGKKCQINSWYRDPASNSAAGGSASSTHMNGFAVDLNFPTMNEWLNKLQPLEVWRGGVASMSGVFIHIDMGGISDTAKFSPGRRWNY